MINIVSSSDIYTHEWASFSANDFPENKYAKTGDIVSIITKDFEDKRPCYDIFCFDEDYKKIFTESRMHLIDAIKPLARGDKSFNWINEIKFAPWIICILKRAF